MQKTLQYITASLLIAIAFQSAKGQKKDENIGTEVVNVVKPYTPTISDAFKIKETPSLDDDETSKKQPIKYSITSFPVASTFTPSKGRAAGVDKEKQEQLFRNYFTSGFGSYLTAFAELYVTADIGDNGYVAAAARHLSSNGGIKDIELEDKYLTSSLDLTYGSKMKDFSWNADAGYQIQKYYWYGLPNGYGTFLLPEIRAAVIDRIDEMQTFNNFYVGGHVGFGESIFGGVDLKYNRFWDAYDSEENRIVLKPSMSFDIGDNPIKADIIVDYVAGSFDKDYTGLISPFKYGYANFGLKPSYGMTKDDWSFNIGASVFYSVDMEHDKNKVFIYPNATASLKVVGDLMVFYLGAEGELQQNSYRDFTNENVYVSPTVDVAPTDRQLNGFAGLKGKLSNYISYNVRGGVLAERNKPLFIHNAYDETIPVQEMYKYGNSFTVVYDNLRTLNFFGEIKADFSKNITFGVNADFNKYDAKYAEEAWNLPELKIGANIDFTIGKVFAGAEGYFVGERKDLDQHIDPLTLLQMGNVVSVDSYFDINAHVGYKFGQRLTLWLRGNNLANQAYLKWLYYKVQPIQGMVGASYKFDF